MGYSSLLGTSYFIISWSQHFYLHHFLSFHFTSSHSMLYSHITSYLLVTSFTVHHYLLVTTSLCLALHGSFSFALHLFLALVIGLLTFSFASLFGHHIFSHVAIIFPLIFACAIIFYLWPVHRSFHRITISHIFSQFPVLVAWESEPVLNRFRLWIYDSVNLHCKSLHLNFRKFCTFYTTLHCSLEINRPISSSRHRILFIFVTILAQILAFRSNSRSEIFTFSHNEWLVSRNKASFSRSLGQFLARPRSRDRDRTRPRSRARGI